MSDKRDKTTGLPLPSPVDPGSTVCVSMTIPNAPEYRQALRGVIAELGKYWTWSQTVGQSSDPALEAAELWRAAALTIVYAEECPEEMSCADVQDCIETDEGTRQAIAGIAGQSAQPGTTATPGERLPDSRWAANLTPTDDCDLNAFWAQCSAFVNYAVTAGIDFLEILETYSNAVEASAFIELAPVIGTLMDEAQVDQVIQFIDWCLSIVQEAFIAADTQPNRQAIACALFCAMRANCELTLEGAFETINDRLGGVLTPSDLDSTSDLITAAVTIAANPAFPLDTWLAIVLALGRTMGYFGIQGINQALNLVLKVAVNDANDGWELLCTDCPPEPDTWRVWEELDPAYNFGTITSQDANSLVAEAGANTDGIYRIVLKAEACHTITVFDISQSGIYGNRGCEEWDIVVDPNTHVEPGDIIDRFELHGPASGTPYTLNMSWT